MNLPTCDFPFVLLTPAMVGGAEARPASLQGKPNPARPRQPNPESGSAPEMRPASIRGQVRWWHRFARLTPAADEVWGRTGSGPPMASRVRLEVLPRPPFEHALVRTLPHAGQDPANAGKPWAKVESQRRAIREQETFTLRLTRLPGCGEEAWQAAQRAVRLWLLLGGLGARANRAAGSVWPVDPGWAPADEPGLAAELTRLGYRRPVRLAEAALGSTPAELRKAASDTVEDENFLGTAKAGRRRASPLKMKVIRLGDRCRLLLAAPKPATLAGAQTALAAKPLGKVAWTPVVG